MTPEYRVTVRVKNNLILRALERAGVRNMTRWCEENDVCYTSLSNLIQLRESPLRNNGTLRAPASKLCDALGVIPEDLWTRDQLYPLEKNFSEIELGGEALSALIDGHSDQPALDDLADSTRVSELLDAAMSRLTAREADVLRKRFGLDGDGEEMTLQAVAEEYGVKRERIRQLEAKALRKLRNPSIAKDLAGCLPYAGRFFE